MCLSHDLHITLKIYVKKSNAFILRQIYRMCEGHISYLSTSLEQNNGLPLWGQRGHFRQKIVCAMAQKQETAFHDQRTARMTGKLGVCQTASTERTGKADRRQNLHTKWGPLDVITIDPHDKSQAQSVTIIYTFDTCKLSFLKFICNTRNNTCSASSVTHRPAEQQTFLCAFPER